MRVIVSFEMVDPLSLKSILENSKAQPFQTLPRVEENLTRHGGTTNPIKHGGFDAIVYDMHCFFGRTIALAELPAN